MNLPPSEHPELIKLIAELRVLGVQALEKNQYEVDCKTGKVISLNLSGLDLDLVPSSISDLTLLNYLNLRDNKLTSLPNRFSKLKYIAKLNLSENELEEIPECIENYNYLEVLNLESNEIKTVPHFINNLKNLVCINLADNPIDDLSPFSTKSKLKILDLGNNIIPDYDGIQNLLHLEILCLVNNQLTEIPPPVLEIYSLKSLYLDKNELNGSHISWLTTQKQLTSLCINDNKLIRLPTFLCSLYFLEYIGIDGNPLETIPIEILKMNSLQFLSLKRIKTIKNLEILKEFTSNHPLLIHLDEDIAIENQINKELIFREDRMVSGWFDMMEEKILAFHSGDNHDENHLNMDFYPYYYGL
jgi:Leucine-rich repeat (LRR) protein